MASYTPLPQGNAFNLPTSTFGQPKKPPALKTILPGLFNTSGAATPTNNGYTPLPQGNVFKPLPQASFGQPAAQQSAPRQQYEQSVAQPQGFSQAPAVAQPAAAPQTDRYASYKSAMEQYIKSLGPSQQETDASNNLNNLTLQSKKDYEEALTRGDTLGFASGEAQRVNRNNSFGIEAASNALNALTGQRSASTEAQRTRLDFEKGLADMGAEDDRYASEQAGKQNQPFSLNEGESRYAFDPKTGQYTNIASRPKTYAPKAPIVPKVTTPKKVSTTSAALPEDEDWGL